MKTHKLGLAGLVLISFMSCNIRIPIEPQNKTVSSSNSYISKIEHVGTYEDEYTKVEVYHVTDSKGKVHRMTKTRSSGIPRTPDVYFGR